MNPLEGAAGSEHPEAGPGLGEAWEPILGGVVQACREDLDAWLTATLPGLLRGFRSRLADQLFSQLDAESLTPGQEDAEAFEEERVDPIRAILVRGRLDALEGIGGEARAWVQARGLQAQQALVDHLAAVSVSERLEAPRSGLLAALEGGAWTWQPPGLARLAAAEWRPAFQVPEPGFLRLLPPGRWVRRRVAARVRRPLAEALEALLADLGKSLHEYLDASLDSLEEALRLFLRQAEAAAQGRGALPAPGVQQAGPQGTAGCAVCAEVWDALYGFLCHWQGAWERDPAIQAAFLEGPGFCPKHLWLLESFASPRSLCGGLPPLLLRLSDRLMEGGDSLAERAWPAGMPVHAERCAACQAQEQATLVSIEQWAIALSQGGAPPDLCLQHLPRVLARAGPPVRELLVRRTAIRLRGIAQAMAGFSLKSDALRRDLLTPAERQAHREALECLAGYRALGIFKEGPDA